MTPEPDLRSLAREATPGPWYANLPDDAALGWEVVAYGGTGTVPRLVGDFSGLADAAWIAAASPDRILALLDAKEAAETLAAASVEVTNDMTTAYMVGFEKGKEAAGAQVAGLRSAAQALLDEMDAEVADNHPLADHYRRQAVERLRAALESEATDAK